jgi:hypothetical protein
MRPVSKVLLAFFIVCLVAIFAAAPFGFEWAPEVRRALVVTAVALFVGTVVSTVQGASMRRERPMKSS